ncbi:MAG TPA: GNAT family N-acetyltransferase [Marmoricola sp.]|jgi:GNAT superfamily N-acetyltransferase|nr:GNAT family N-acetyltransferase [Marmoricola sp.]
MDEFATLLLQPDDWALWRLIRLRSLAADPEAFGSTFEREVVLDEAGWRASLGTGGPRVVVVAGIEPVALGGGFVEDAEDGQHLHVIAMWTDPAYRGRRLAARVLDALVEWAAPRGLGLVLDVAIGNSPARHAYEAYGFAGTPTTRPIRDGSSALVEQMVLRRG